MSFFDLDAECSDENEGSIITSLISQLRQAYHAAFFRYSLTDLAYPELEWIYQRLHFRHSFSNLGACSRGSPISCRIPTLSLGKSSSPTTIPEVAPNSTYPAPKVSTIQKSVSSGFCSIISLAGISSPRASRSRESGEVILTQGSAQHQLRLTDITLYSENFSGADTTILMGHKVSTSLNKVRSAKQPMGLNLHFS